MKQLNPITIENFFEITRAETDGIMPNYNDFFSKEINVIQHCAMGPYCWLILDFCKTKIIDTSQNIGQLTPYSKEMWTDSDMDFLIYLIHPDDRLYFLSAINATVFADQLTEEGGSGSRASIYGRMLDNFNEYRWVLFRPVKRRINKYKQIDSLLGVIYDLSQYKTGKLPVLSVIETGKEEVHYYKRTQLNCETVHLPKITDREKEILRLMAKGYTTPTISKELYLSYHTVENHKRNLRNKTNTKTSVELLSFVVTNGILQLGQDS